MRTAHLLQRSTLALFALLGSTGIADRAHAQDPTTADCLGAAEKSTLLRQQHRLRSARAELSICAAASCPRDVREECGRRVAEVNTSMPTLVFEAHDPAGNDLSTVRVVMDGQPLVDRLEGTAISIDPGEHVFRFDTAGMRPVNKMLVIRVGEKERRERIVFAPLAESEPRLSGGVTAVGATATAVPANQDRSDSNTTLRNVGFVVGGLGIAGLGMAIYEQTVALDRYDRSKRAAGSSNVAVQQTSGELHDQASKSQVYAIVFGVSGAAALGVGLYLAITGADDSTRPTRASRAPRVSPMLGRGVAGVRVQQIW